MKDYRKTFLLVVLIFAVMGSPFVPSTPCSDAAEPGMTEQVEEIKSKVLAMVASSKLEGSSQSMTGDAAVSSSEWYRAVDEEIAELTKAAGGRKKIVLAACLEAAIESASEMESWGLFYFSGAVAAGMDRVEALESIEPYIDSPESDRGLVMAEEAAKGLLFFNLEDRSASNDGVDRYFEKHKDSPSPGITLVAFRENPLAALRACVGSASASELLADASAVLEYDIHGGTGNSMDKGAAVAVELGRLAGSDNWPTQAFVASMYRNTSKFHGPTVKAIRDACLANDTDPIVQALLKSPLDSVKSRIDWCKQNRGWQEMAAKARLGGTGGATIYDE